MGLRNTSKHGVHLDWLMGGNPGAIEAQEKRGQDELVTGNLLPTDVTGKEKLEGLGVVFGEPLESDPLFCEAQIPNGWQILATDHSMWNELQDENGDVVARIFYKAAFYDRRAHMHIKED